MRLPILTTALLFVSLSPLAANEPPTIVTLGENGTAETFRGTINAGATKSFTYTAAKARSVTLTIDASSEDCGAEMRTNLEHGFMPEFGRFPLKRTERAEAGETLKISFFQTRVARTMKIACAFSLSVQ